MRKTKMGQELIAGLREMANPFGYCCYTDVGVPCGEEAVVEKDIIAIDRKDFTKHCTMIVPLCHKHGELKK